MITFLDSIKEYKKRTGKSSLTKQEVHNLREQYENFVEKHQSKDTLKESKKPLNDMNVVVANYKKVKESKGLGTKVSYKELKTLQEGVDTANRRGIALKEADPNFMADQAAQAPAPAADPNAAPADPNAAMGAAPVDPGIQSQIQDLLQQVQALAQTAGVTVDDLGANPEANIGAVDGMADPNAAPAVDAAADPNAPLVEAVKKAYESCERIDEASFMKILESVNAGKTRTHLDLVQERVNLRTARMSLQEDACGANDFAKAYLKQLGVSMENFEKHNPGSVDESQLKNMPSEAQLAKGVSTGAAAKETKPADRWPTKPIKTVQLQGEGAKKITESVEPTVTDQYLNNYFAEKLDFSKIKESMKQGLLG